MCVGAGLFWDGCEQGILDFILEANSLEKSRQDRIFIAAIISILIKETLYRLTLYVGKKENSQAVIANAWHHRSDAFLLSGRRWVLEEPSS